MTHKEAEALSQGDKIVLMNARTAYFGLTTLTGNVVKAAVGDILIVEQAEREKGGFTLFVHIHACTADGTSVVVLPDDVDRVSQNG